MQAPGVVPPIGPGAAHVLLRSRDALRLGMLSVLAIDKAGVPEARVDVIWPVALIVVNAPDVGVVPPIAP